MIRFIVKEIAEVKGETLVTYHTFTDAAELEAHLGDTWFSRQLVGAEVTAEATAPTAETKDADTDNIPF